MNQLKTRPTTPTGKRLAHINDDAGFIEDCYLIDTDDILAIENEAVGEAYLDGMRAASRLADQLADALLLTKQWALGGHGKAPLATINAALAAYEKRNTLS